MTPEHKALVAAGAAMANILYNLTQARAFGSPEIHASMNEAREEWDRCRSAIESLSAQSAQPQAGEADRDRLAADLRMISNHVRPLVPKGQNAAQADTALGIIGYMVLLAADNARLREALEKIAGARMKSWPDADIARTALAGKE